MDAPREPAEPTDEPHAWPVETLRFAPRVDAPGFGRLHRALAGLGVVALHAWLWWFVDAHSGMRTAPRPYDDEAIVIDWIRTLPPQRILAPAGTATLGPAPRPDAERRAPRDGVRHTTHWPSSSAHS